MGDPGMCSVEDERHAGNQLCGWRITTNAAVDATSFDAAVKHK